MLEELAVDIDQESALQDQLRQEEQKQRALSALTISLLDKRKKAVEWREQLGIEQEWEECEEAYEGIDDANRGTESTAMHRTVRPRGDGGSILRKPKTSTRSTVFMPITRPYCDAAAARVADMLLPTDDSNFTYRPTPIPQLSEIDPFQLPPEALQQMGVQSIDQFLELQTDDAKLRAKRAQTRVEDWLVECQYHAEVRSVIEDCARLGTGILKGPIPSKRKRMRVVQSEFGLEMKITEEIVPISRRVDPWNIYPDPSCGERIANGSYLFERERLSAKQLMDLIGQEGYLDDAIRKCILEGPSKINISTSNRETSEDDRYEAWYFYGQVSKDDFESVTSGDEVSMDFVNVVCTMVNDRIIKMSPSHLDSGDFPFDMIPWQRRTGMPYGIGVAKQISVPQRMLNGATRRMNDNAGLSSAPQIIRFKGVVTPADGVWELTPGKIWDADPESSVQDVSKAFLAIEIPTRQAELMNIIQFSLKMAEDVTGLPMLMQGNQGQAPDTVGGMTILNNNANTVLRRIARLFDDCITEPHMRRYYEWIMLYGSEYEKGDFVVDALGSTGLVERDIQQRALIGMGELVLNPAYGADPQAWFKETLKAQKVDPKLVMLSPEKQAQQMQQQEQQMQAEQQAQQEAMQMQHEMMGAEHAHEERMQDRELAADVAMNREDNQVAMMSSREKLVHDTRKRFAERSKQGGNRT